MELNLSEALRYAGVPEPAPKAMQKEIEDIASKLTAAITPRWHYRTFPLEATSDGIFLPDTGILLTGNMARTMLSGCDSAALLACTLGTEFDTMLRRTQAVDMRQALFLDACGNAWTEAGCDAAEEELKMLFPKNYLTDRFSPGYGDLPLNLQPALCRVLDVSKRLGITVSESLLLNPVKSVTAIIGISTQPQKARIRGCQYCSMHRNCSLQRGGTTCGV